MLLILVALYFLLVAAAGGARDEVGERIRGAETKGEMRQSTFVADTIFWKSPNALKGGKILFG